MAGLFLRIYGLSTESLWLDEGFSVWHSKTDIPLIIKAASSDVQMPLYYILLHYWMGLFGDSEFSIRFLSVIFGLLAVFLVYKIGDVLFNKETGIISSLIMAFTLFQIYYSQEARLYSFMLFLSLMSVYFFILTMKSSKLKHTFPYIISTALLVYTHFFGWFIVIFQNLYFIYAVFFQAEKRCKIKFWVLSQVTILVLFAVWIPILISQISGTIGGKFVYWIPTPNILSVIFSLVEFGSLGGIFVFFALLFHFRSELFQTENYRKILRREKFCLLFLWLFAPVLLTFLISIFLANIYTNKYIIMASPALYILLAKGVSSLKPNFKKIAIAAFIALSIANLYPYYTTVEKEQWKEAVGYINGNAKAGDMVLFDAWYVQYGAFNYYFNRADVLASQFLEGGIVPPNFERFWVVRSHALIPDLIEKLSKKYKLLENRSYFGVELYLFEK